MIIPSLSDQFIRCSEHPRLLLGTHGLISEADALKMRIIILETQTMYIHRKRYLLNESRYRCSNIIEMAASY